MKLACMLAMAFVYQMEPIVFTGECNIYSIGVKSVELSYTLPERAYLMKLERNLDKVGWQENQFHGIDDPMSNPILEHIIGF